MAVVVLVLAMPRWLNDWLVARIATEVDGHLSLSVEPEARLDRPGLALRDLRWTPSAGAGGITIEHLEARTTWSAPTDGGRALLVAVDGVDAQVHQASDGRWQMPQLADDGGATDEAGALPVYLSQMRLSDVRLRLVPTSGAPIALSLSEGQLSADGATWVVTAQLSARRADLHWAGQVRARIDPQAMTLDAVVLDGQGEVGGWPLARLVVRMGLVDGAGSAVVVTDAQVSAAAPWPGEGGGTVQLDVRIPTLQADSEGASAQLADLVVHSDGRPALRLSAPSLAVRMDDHGVAVAPLRAQAQLSTDAGPLDLTLSDGRVHADWATNTLRWEVVRFAAELPVSEADRVRIDGQFDGQGGLDMRRAEGRLEAQAEGSRIDARWWFDAASAPPLRVLAQVDQLDLDRWRTGAAAGGDGAVPLAAWRDWPLALELAVGQLRWQGVSMRDARLRLNGPEPPPE